jgi:hypothetical protein
MICFLHVTNASGDTPGQVSIFAGAPSPDACLYAWLLCVLVIMCIGNSLPSFHPLARRLPTRAWTLSKYQDTHLQGVGLCKSSGTR